LGGRTVGAGLNPVKKSGKRKERKSGAVGESFIAR
jgi:hypothetical protein